MYIKPVYRFPLVFSGHFVVCTSRYPSIHGSSQFFFYPDAPDFRLAISGTYPVKYKKRQDYPPGYVGHPSYFVTLYLENMLLVYFISIYLQFVETKNTENNFF